MISSVRKSYFFPIVLSIFLAACAPAAQTQTPTFGLDLAHPVIMRLALLPILDALPIYVAQEKGYFKTAGLQVEFVAANSAVERDQLMAAGQADGMINDLVSVVLYDRDQVTVQVLRFAQLASKGFPVYRIVASQQSGIQDVNGLRGVEIAISQGTVIDYVTDRLLTAAGLSPQEVKTIAVPKIADRLSLLANGGLKAATLPEPFATQAVKAGGKVILDDSGHPELGNSVISFRKSFIDANPAAVKAFLSAVDKAVADINTDPTAWSDVLSKYHLLPADLLPTYPIPPFPNDSWPTQAQFEDVVAWATAKQLISKPVDYTQAMYVAFK
jgi:NitT/TauT family transport system substrate-binding protein